MNGLDLNHVGSDDYTFARRRIGRRAVERFPRKSQSRRGARALEQIWLALEKLEDFPLLGMPTENPDIRQLVVRFAGSGYIIRYALIADMDDILITRIWHGREARR